MSEVIERESSRFSIFLIMAGFLVSSLYYLVTPIIPIYFVESALKGGLEWSREYTFSLFGTYLAVACTAPFLGGLCADFLVGRKVVAYIGYVLGIVGLGGLAFCSSSSAILWNLLFFALGSGFVKVSLMSSIGTICAGRSQSIRQFLYDRYYIGISLGFVSGNFLANWIFDGYGIAGIATCALLALIVSAVLGLKAISTYSIGSNHVDSENTSISGTTWVVISVLICLGVFFFLVSHQTHTSICLFVHQMVDRSVGGFIIPTLWFSAFGSLSMVFFVPFRGMFWKKIDMAYEMSELVKVGFGFLMSAIAFLFLSVLARYPNQVSGQIFLLFLSQALFFIADVHVRPILFSSATRYVSSQYHTFSTAMVYTSIGLGGKLAGFFAGYIDIIGFSYVFLFSAILCSVCMSVAVLMWSMTKKVLVLNAV